MGDNRERMDYKKAGVDLEAAAEAVEKIKKLARGTFRPEVLTGIGGYGGLFALPVHRYREPVLVSSTDGVGTKLKLAFMTGIHHTVGLDLVAMCVNDVVVLGAEPLFFLDYLATGKLEPGQVTEIVSGVARGCREAGCALVGGEIAEMPDFYRPGEYDLAGFAVGVVERDKIIDGSRGAAGDRLVGIASSGLHSNGYSLVRKVLLEGGHWSLENKVPALGCTLGEELLRPTRIYVSLLKKLSEKVNIKAMAHITGGGFYENIPRVLPPGTSAVIKNLPAPPPIFSFLQEEGNIGGREMYRTFNMGVGMVLMVGPGEEERLLEEIEKEGSRGYALGEVVPGGGEVRLGGIDFSPGLSR